MMERRIDDMVAELRRRHPWMDMETAQRIADDDVRAEMDEDRDDEDRDDPFPEKGGKGHGGGVLIVFGKGRKAPESDDRDPFPED